MQTGKEANGAKVRLSKYLLYNYILLIKLKKLFTQYWKLFRIENY